MALALPFRANCPTNADRFRQIFRDHWDQWCDLRLEDEVPADQRAYVRETVPRMTALPCAVIPTPVMPGMSAPAVALTSMSLFRVRVGRAACPSCGKIRVDEWVNGITPDLLEVPHLHLTLTIDDALRPFFHAERALLDDLLQVAAQAVKAVLIDLYPGVWVGMIYTPHTFGRDLGFKPHVHLVMTKGG